MTDKDQGGQLSAGELARLIRFVAHDAPAGTDETEIGRRAEILAKYVAELKANRWLAPEEPTP